MHIYKIVQKISIEKFTTFIDGRIGKTLIYNVGTLMLITKVTTVRIFNINKIFKF